MNAGHLLIQVVGRNIGERAESATMASLKARGGEVLSGRFFALLETSTPFCSGG